MWKNFSREFVAGTKRTAGKKAAGGKK